MRFAASLMKHFGELEGVVISNFRIESLEDDQQILEFLEKLEEPIALDFSQEDRDSVEEALGLRRIESDLWTFAA